MRLLTVQAGKKALGGGGERRSLTNSYVNRKARPSTGGTNGPGVWYRNTNGSYADTVYAWVICANVTS